MRRNIEVKHSEMVDYLTKDPREIVKTMSSEKADLVHMAMGIAGEAGELLDAVKKHVMYNKDLDIENVIEELGDLEFYMEGMRQILLLNRDAILAENIEKLMVGRYPNGYSDQAAQERADKKEQ